MEEKILIKSEQYNFKKILMIMLIVCIGIFGYGLILFFLNADGCREAVYSFESFLWEMGYPFELDFHYMAFVWMDLGLILLLVAGLIAWWLSSDSICQGKEINIYKNVIIITEHISDTLPKKPQITCHFSRRVI